MTCGEYILLRQFSTTSRPGGSVEAHEADCIDQADGYQSIKRHECQARRFIQAMKGDADDQNKIVASSDEQSAETTLHVAMQDQLDFA